MYQKTISAKNVVEALQMNYRGRFKIKEYICVECENLYDNTDSHTNERLCKSCVYEIENHNYGFEKAHVIGYGSSNGYKSSGWKIARLPRKNEWE